MQREIFQFRWVAVSATVVLLVLALKSGVLDGALIAFALGTAGGFALDAIAAKFRWWDYTRTPFMGTPYLLITLPSWGTLGMMIAASFWWLHQFDIPTWAVAIIVTIALFVSHEGLNRVTESWQYHVPTWLVVAGWFPMILLYHIVFTLIPRGS